MSDETEVPAVFREQCINKELPALLECGVTEKLLRQMEERVFQITKKNLSAYEVRFKSYVHLMKTRATQDKEKNPMQANASPSTSNNPTLSAASSGQPQTDNIQIKQEPAVGPYNALLTAAGLSTSLPQNQVVVDAPDFATETVEVTTSEPVPGPSQPLSNYADWEPKPGPSRMGYDPFLDPVPGPSHADPGAGPSNSNPSASGTYSSEMGSSGLNIVFRRVPGETEQVPILCGDQVVFQTRELKKRDDSIIVLDDDEDEDHNERMRLLYRRQQPTKRVDREGNLELCNAIYMDLDVVFEEDWESPPTCTCKSMPYDILGNTNLTPNLAATFLEMCDYPVPQLIQTLNLYGELNVSAGCKTRLLLQMKQLLIDQSTLQRETETGTNSKVDPLCATFAPLHPPPSSNNSVPFGGSSSTANNESPFQLTPITVAAGPSPFTSWQNCEESQRNSVDQRSNASPHSTGDWRPQRQRYASPDTFRDPRAKKRSFLSRVMSSSSSDESEDFSLSIIKMKRNKPNNSGQRQRKTPQPPTSPPPPTVSPLYQRDDNEEEEPTLWPNQRRRSAGPLAAPQFQIPTVVSMPAWNPNQLPQLPENNMNAHARDFMYNPPQPARYVDPERFDMDQQFLQNVLKHRENVERRNAAEKQERETYWQRQNARQQERELLENEMAEMRAIQNFQRDMANPQNDFGQQMAFNMARAVRRENRPEFYTTGVPPKLSLCKRPSAPASASEQKMSKISKIIGEYTESAKKIANAAKSQPTAAGPSTVIKATGAAGPSAVVIPVAAIAGPSKAPASSAPTATISKPPAGKDVALDERLECCICFETKREIVFLPCRHMVCCNKCSSTVQECPMCRVEIVDKFSVFLS